MGTSITLEYRCIKKENYDSEQISHFCEVSKQDTLKTEQASQSITQNIFFKYLKVSQVIMIMSESNKQSGEIN